MAFSGRYGTMLGDLDFADDVALLTHNYNQMREKINQKESAGKLGLSVSKGKTKSMRMKPPITVR